MKRKQKLDGKDILKVLGSVSDFRKRKNGRQVKSMKAKLEERKKSLEADFTRLTEEGNKLREQGGQLQRKLNEIQAEQVRLQGSY